MISHHALPKNAQHPNYHLWDKLDDLAIETTLLELVKTLKVTFKVIILVTENEVNVVVNGC